MGAHLSHAESERHHAIRKSHPLTKPSATAGSVQPTGDGKGEKKGEKKTSDGGRPTDAIICAVGGLGGGRAMMEAEDEGRGARWKDVRPGFLIQRRSGSVGVQPWAALTSSILQLTRVGCSRTPPAGGGWHTPSFLLAAAPVRMPRPPQHVQPRH